MEPEKNQISDSSEKKITNLGHFCSDAIFQMLPAGSIKHYKNERFTQFAKFRNVSLSKNGHQWTTFLCLFPKLKFCSTQLQYNASRSRLSQFGSF